MKRRKIIAGNWKMNLAPAAARALVEEIKPLCGAADWCDVVVCPPFVDLAPALEAARGTALRVGAQNVHFEPKGAYTGEIAAGMLTELGVTHVIVGHSERRQYFGETDETVNRRVRAALAAGLTVILCVGETLAEREQGVTFPVVERQTRIALLGVTAEELGRVVIAYEPVWAIGTGRTATSAQADEVCGFLRKVVGDLYGADAAEAFLVQYGGSMNAANAAELLAMPNIDGGLIGGASLKAPDFAAIVNAAR